MKRGIEHLPIAERPELERIIAMILEEFEDVISLAQREWKAGARIAKIVLYGSRARGEGVDEHHTHVGKHSDWDLIVIVDDERLTNRNRYWQTVAERLSREYQITHRLRSPAQFLVYTMERINKSLESGRYFFLDFLRDGIIVYETDESEFLQPRPLSVSRSYAMSQEYFNDWFSDALEYYDDYDSNIRRGRLKKAAVELHQCVEGLYHTVLLTYTLYTPHSRNIVELRSAAEKVVPELIAAWPRELQKDRDAFENLQLAYVKSHYPRDYHITEDQLGWLGEHARVLIDLVRASCENHLAELERAAAS